MLWGNGVFSESPGHLREHLRLFTKTLVPCSDGVFPNDNTTSRAWRLAKVIT